MTKLQHPVIAIGLDACEPSLLEKWIDEGHLENIRRLRERGIYGRLENFKDSNVETAWTTFSTGCRPQKTGYWAAMGLREGTYETETRAAYDYREYPPFCALGENYRVATFDVPQLRLHDDIRGIQVAAWGAHSPQVPCGSKPADLYQEIINTYGAHPTLHRDYAACLDVKKVLRLQKDFEIGIARRSLICQDLLQREPWDLFLTVFGEPHGAGHLCWQLSQPDHPLYEMLSARVSYDPYLSIFKAIDRAIGEILTKIPDNARLVLFSAHGMGSATIDLPSFVFLPEFLYRYSFPGKYGLGDGNLEAPLRPMFTKMKWNWWDRHVWGTKYDPNPIRSFLRKETPSRIFKLIERFLDPARESDLTSPFELLRQGETAVPWMPAQWYKSLWSKMKAFAVPSFAEGYVRINLKGREPQGIVEPSEYEAVCDEICAKLHQLRDARKGIPMVDRIVRTRKSAADRDPKLPDADLIIIWQEKYATDVVESPEYGRFGPLPPYRAASHRAEGFMLACGAGIEEGSELLDGHVLDIAPTILSMMDAQVPSHLDGRALQLLSMSTRI